MAKTVFVHEFGDSVGVVLQDVVVGDELVVSASTECSGDSFFAYDDIPRFHKVALSGVAKDQDLIEYGETIGVATAMIHKGELVHIHNLKTKRW